MRIISMKRFWAWCVAYSVRRQGTLSQKRALRMLTKWRGKDEKREKERDQ